jgi:hypothetical protein
MKCGRQAGWVGRCAAMGALQWVRCKATNQCGVGCVMVAYQAAAGDGGKLCIGAVVSCALGCMGKKRAGGGQAGGALVGSCGSCSAVVNALMIHMQLGSACPRAAGPAGPPLPAHHPPSLTASDTALAR